MKRLVLPIAALAAIATSVSAQNSRLFAITGETKGNINWNTVREIKTKDGDLKNTIYAPQENRNVMMRTVNKQNENPNNEAAFGPIAASGYDAKTNRLYYTNMRGTSLNYIDLNKSSLDVVKNEDAKFNTGDKFKSEAAIITRMTFGSDGNGYALTNDGEHLIRFSTDNAAMITDLGRLTDASANGNNSVHNQCSSWGGDLVGDAFGNLYLITMSASVYKINTRTLVTELVGKIKGLPTNFTANGAAVDENGDLIVSGAAHTEAYYKVNIATLDVVAPVKTELGVYNASDLASANLLYQSKATLPTFESVVVGAERISVYPNPAVGKVIKMQVSNPSSDKYSVQVTDLRGKTIFLSNAATTEGQSIKVSLPTNTPSGTYILKVSNSDNKSVYNSKLIVQ